MANGCVGNSVCQFRSEDIRAGLGMKSRTRCLQTLKIRSKAMNMGRYKWKHLIPIQKMLRHFYEFKRETAVGIG